MKCGTAATYEADSGALLPVALKRLCGGLARGSYNKVRARNGKEGDSNQDQERAPQNPSHCKTAIYLYDLFMINISVN